MCYLSEISGRSEPAAQVGTLSPEITLPDFCFMTSHWSLIKGKTCPLVFTITDSLLPGGMYLVYFNYNQRYKSHFYSTFWLK